VLSTDAAVLSDRAQVNRLRGTLARERMLFEPRREGGVTDWRRVSGGEAFDWDVPASLPSAKRFFFPARETLVRWQGETVEEVLPQVEPFALFGLRPCDVTAIGYQDRFFATDPAYVRRRAQALLVTVNCHTACPGGFCPDVEAGPFARTGFDLSLTPLAEGRVVVEIGTDRGRELMGAAHVLAQPFDRATRATYEATHAAALASFPARPFIRRAIARISTRQITEAEWQALGPSCLACTGCTNLCPTCSCFTVVDEPREGGGERVRHWDSCLLDGFQREASGYHPAPRPGDRVRRFWDHKLSDDFTTDFGRPGCVGCGRCDVTCPGSIGALAVLGRLGAP
jgi:formate hydrogenlyase subunit 6/NADH:ubiquinone oxidoreductase subunit I